MAAKPKKKNFFQKFVAWIKEAVEWAEETFADPALTKALKEDLGLNTAAATPMPAQSPASKAKIDAFLAKEDIDEIALAETIGEIVAVVEAIVQFADTIKAEGLSAWDVVWLLGQVSASDSLRVRLPAAYAIAKLLLFVSDDPDAVEALDPGKLATILRGEPLPPGSGEIMVQRISAGVGLLLLIGELVVDKLTAREGTLDVLYGWDPDPESGSPDADFISQRAATLLTTFPTEPATTVGLTLLGVPPEHGGPGIFLALSGALDFPVTTDGVAIDIKLAATSAFWLFIPRGDGARDFEAGGDPTGYLRIDAHPAAPPTEPALLAGIPGGTRLEVGGYGFGLELGAERGALRLSLVGAKLVISLGDGDGFIQQLPGGAIEIPFALGLTIDSEHGVRFDGGTALRVNLPVSATLFGVFTIQYLELALGPAPKNGLTFELSGGFSLKLGPFKASVDRLGLLADTSRLDDGALGNLDRMLAFKPPNGIGLALDAGMVKGGGYLYVDPQRGEYAGALELGIQLPAAGKIGIKAIGILSTKRPDGSEGWALLIMIFAQFRIQLSWGFTLNGLGGILGLHHRVDLPALGDGLRTGVMDDILFPADPVADAPRIINRLRVVFPILEGTLTIGPAMELGWGTPTLIDIKLALLLEVDNALGGGPIALSKIVLLGQLLVQVPPKDLGAPAVVKLLIDVLGAYDADQDWLFIRARLRDSFVGVGGGASPTKLVLTGELLVSMQFGGDPAFLLSAGGFHPRFQDLPANVPANLDRIGAAFPISMLKLKIEIYFAVTSNTIQAGLNVELSAKLGPVTIKGWLGFDALCLTEPTFHFTVDVRFGVSVKYKSFNLCGIDVKATIDGPGLWHAVGHASFSVLWWDVPIDFDESWGGAPSVIEGTVNAALALVAEVERLDNWSAQLPSGTDQLVTLAGLEGVEGVAAHPLGRLVFLQRVVPLGLDIVRIGEKSVDGARRFELGPMQLGSLSIAQPEAVMEHFARAQFVERTEEQKLTDASFERFPAGAALGTSAYSVSAAVSHTSLEYEERYLEPEEGGLIGWKIIRGLATVTISHELVTMQAEFGAAARSPRNVAARLRGNGGREIQVDPPPLVVADATHLTAAAVDLPGAAAHSPSLAAQVVAGTPGTVLIEAYELGGVP